MASFATAADGLRRDASRGAPIKRTGHANQDRSPRCLKPGDTPSTANSRPKTNVRRSRPDATLTVPDGFTVNVFAEGLGNARNMIVAANGDVLLAESELAGKITLLRDSRRRRQSRNVVTFAERFPTIPYGIAFAQRTRFMSAIMDGVWRFPYTPGDTKARAKQTRITPDGAFGVPAATGRATSISAGRQEDLCRDRLGRQSQRRPRAARHHPGARPRRRRRQGHQPAHLRQRPAQSRRHRVLSRHQRSLRGGE